MRLCNCVGTLLFCVGSAACASVSTAQLRYSVTEMVGAQPGALPIRINNHETAIGGTGSGVQPWIWSAANGVTTLHGPTTLAAVYDINDAGRVCGADRYNSGQRALAGTPPQPLMPLDSVRSDVFAINQSGDVIGARVARADVIEAGVIWRASGVVEPLAPYRDTDTFTFLTAINEAGDVAGVGGGSTTSQTLRPRFWPHNMPARALPTLGGGGDFVLAMNIRREIAGYSSQVLPGSATTSKQQSVMWRVQSNEIIHLGNLAPYLGGIAFAISDFSVVVGECSNRTTTLGTGWETLGTAFIWTQPSGMIELDTLLSPQDAGWHIIAATDINEHGTIAGVASFDGSDPKAVLLRPFRLSRADIAGAYGLDTLPDGQLDEHDVIAYLNQFFSPNHIIADMASVGGIAGPDGQLTIDDLIYFLYSFFGGQ